MTGLQRVSAAGLVLAVSLFSQIEKPVVGPGKRVVVDAHNCYPYNGRWGDRIDRALSVGLPVAIEQDLLWYTDTKTGRSWSIDSHGKPIDGTEPVMRDYFFERIRPIMDKALRDGNKGDWPLITLNLDFKSNEAEHHAAVWKLLSEYAGWMCTAVRGSDPSKVMPMKAGPLLVLTGDDDSQEHDFYSIVPPGERLLVFGAVHSSEDFSLTPQKLLLGSATNYRRWWNNPWRVVENGGQVKAGVWTADDEQRLKSLVDYAHSQNLWMRFYTLNGHAPELLKENGWDHGYDFGSRDAVELRWHAAIAAGVDYLATDQYEDLGKFKGAL
jgi:hypothetical protein